MKTYTNDKEEIAALRQQLEKVKSKLASAMRAETHPKAKDYLIDEAIEIIDAALAASKGEKA